MSKKPINKKLKTLDANDPRTIQSERKRDNESDEERVRVRDSESDREKRDRESDGERVRVRARASRKETYLRTEEERPEGVRDQRHRHQLQASGSRRIFP